MKRPNILLLILDSARADHLSCYGYHRKTTPNIDRLAEQGTVFTNHYSVANETFPSHVSIFTGIHPYFHGAAINFSKYNGRYPTIQEILTEYGYQSIGLTKNPVISSLTGISRGFQRYHEIWKLEKPRENREDNGNKREKGYLRTVIRRTKRYLKEQIKDTKLFKPIKETLDGFFDTQRRKYQRCQSRLERRGADNRGGRTIINLIKEEMVRCKQARSNFYVFANLIEPHLPYLSPKNYRNLFLQDETSSYYNVSLSLFKREYSKKLRFEFLPEEWAVINALYDASLAYTDALLGDLFSFMEREGIMDETLTIITSDHGDLLGEHGYLGHRLTLYEPLIRVPLVIRYPEKFRCGYFDEGLTQSIDLFPTILNLVKAERKGSYFNYKGIDLSLDGKKGMNDRYIVIDDLAGRNDPRLQFYKYENDIERAIITQDFKYVWCNSGRHRLHSAKEDPLEENNLYSEAYRPVIETLHAKMVNWYQEQLDPKQDFDLYRYDCVEADDIFIQIQENKEEEIQVIEKKLRDLGYMD